MIVNCRWKAVTRPTCMLFWSDALNAFPTTCSSWRRAVTTQHNILLLSLLDPFKNGDCTRNKRNNTWNQQQQQQSWWFTTKSTTSTTSPRQYFSLSSSRGGGRRRRIHLVTESRQVIIITTSFTRSPKILSSITLDGKWLYGRSMSILFLVALASQGHSKDAGYGNCQAIVEVYATRK